MRSGGVERGAAGPADLERGGILLAAFRAALRGAHARLEVCVDQPARALGVRGVLDPDLWQRGFDRQLACEARGVRVEDARANAMFGEQIGE
jgi:hypothetical protein